VTRVTKKLFAALLAVAVAVAGGAMSGAVAGAVAGASNQCVNAIDEAAVRAHMGFLAGDAMNGRGSGTRDEWITATYIAAQLRRLGLEPLGDNGDYVETVEIDRNEVVGAPVLSIGASTWVHGEQMMVVRLSAAGRRGALQKYKANVPVQAGATLLMPENAEPDSANVVGAGVVLWHETAAVRSHWGDLGRRVLNAGSPRLAALPAASEKIDRNPSKIWLSAEAYSAVAKLAEGSVATLTVQTREATGRTWNAAARLRGSGKEKDDIILLSAHLDHLGARDTGVERIYNGADDDASGSTAVLALAEALAKGPALNRTLVFAWFGSEEAGGYGARYFVEKPVIPLENIVANLEFEMIGRPDSSIAPHTLWLTGWERTNLGPELAAHGARLVADPHPAENFFARSDNFTLARRGIVAQTVSSFGLHADYHQPSDKLERIDFAHMTEAIQSLLTPVRWLADSDFRPDWAAGGKPP
jgi:aminopeptidase YwaD